MQSSLGSFAEAWANIAIGYGVAVAAQAVVFPWYGLHVSLAENAEMGVLFTVVSLVRSYALRRLFNRWHR